MIITISGSSGSGKSTVAKILKEKLNLERIYVGGIRRELARQKGMTLEELNEYAKTNPETDVDVDKVATKKARDLAAQGKDVIVEGRVQFHFIPESIKIFISVDLDEGVKRIWKDLQNKKANLARNEGVINSMEELKQSVIKREAGDVERYQKYYNINHSDLNQYDLVVDSTNILAEDVANKIIKYLKKINEKS